MTVPVVTPHLMVTGSGATSMAAFISKVAATSGMVSTLTSMAPSPSHLAMRTARREQMSRSAARNTPSTATARSSPSVSVRAVKPDRSRKAKVRRTRTER